MKIYGHSGLGVFGHSGLGVCSDIGGYLDIRGSDVRGSTPNVQKPRTSKNPQCPKPNHSPERPQPRMSLTPNPQPRMSKPRMSTTPNVRQGFLNINSFPVKLEGGCSPAGIGKALSSSFFPFTTTVKWLRAESMATQL